MVLARNYKLISAIKNSVMVEDLGLIGENGISAEMHTTLSVFLQVSVYVMLHRCFTGRP